MPARIRQPALSRLSSSPRRAIPVTIVCGAPGAGKTALIERWIEAHGQRRFAIIADTSPRPENAVGGVGATAFHVRGSVEAFLSQSITDTRQDVLCQELFRTLDSGDVDGVFIEAGLTADPATMVAALRQQRPGYALVDLLDVARVVTVLDCARLQDDYASTQALVERDRRIPPSDERTVANIVALQIESADTIVLNKTDLASAQLRREVCDIATVLNPGAQRIQTRFGELEESGMAADDLFGRVDRAHYGPGWLRYLEETLPTTHAYQVSRCVYKRRRPFHPERLMTLLDNGWPWTLRTRGQFWIASRPDWAIDIQQAGTSVAIQPFGYWWASDVVGGCTPEDPQLLEALNQLWHPLYGDRRQHVAILGVDFDPVTLERDLDDCLLTDAELAGGWNHWRAMADPWPVWR
ncbi:GTP-binding protein [Salinisphaera sp. T31B1]|uniref:CobW family GTP-binding protein n=1 Tax=Salinisphaera sp. T31B1 TaxID=727963 RepID=UPI003341D098